jgi:hypothetical protein
MTLAHTVLAIVGDKPVRVQCNTCGGQHNFRAGGDAARTGGPPPPGTKVAHGRPGATESRPLRARVSFEDALATKPGPDKLYSPKGVYVLDDVIIHPSFGRGYVEAVRADKVDVLFRSGSRTLVHGR